MGGSAAERGNLCKLNFPLAENSLDQSIGNNFKNGKTFILLKQC